MKSDEQVYLGFDASCARCSGLAHSIEHEVGDRLNVVPLSSPDMERWRHKALGRDAPWAPTLVRVREGEVEARVGWRIAPLLAQRVGPRATWRVLGIIGNEALDGKLSKPGRSRRSFLLAGFGAAAGLGMLMSAPHAAAAKPRQEVEAASPDKVTEIEGERLLEAALEHLRGEDAVNVVDPESLGPAVGSATALSAISRHALKIADESTGDMSAGGLIEVAGREIKHGDGTDGTVIFFHQYERRMVLISHRTSTLVDQRQSVYEIGTEVHRLHVDHEAADGPVLRTVTRSVNGAVPTPVPDTDLGLLSENPCGGCCTCCGPRPGRLSSDCNWEWSVSCVFSTVGCAVCLPCSIWWQCLLCVAASCGGALASCCTSFSDVCRRCRRCST